VHQLFIIGIIYNILLSLFLYFFLNYLQKLFFKLKILYQAMMLQLITAVGALLGTSISLLAEGMGKKFTR